MKALLLELTPELRRHFEQIGEALVRRDVERRRYEEPKKQAAALAWLHERETRRERRDSFRWWAIVALTALGAVPVVLALGSYLSS